MDNVKSLNAGSEVAQLAATAPDKELIRGLEMALERARSGELTGGVMLLQYQDGSMFQWRVGRYVPATMIGRLMINASQIAASSEA